MARRQSQTRKVLLYLRRAEGWQTVPKISAGTRVGYDSAMKACVRLRERRLLDSRGRLVGRRFRINAAGLAHLKSPRRYDREAKVRAAKASVIARRDHPEMIKLGRAVRDLQAAALDAKVSLWFQPWGLDGSWETGGAWVLQGGAGEGWTEAANAVELAELIRKAEREDEPVPDPCT